MEYREVMSELERLGDPSSREGMKRYGIVTDKALGVPVPKLRGLARKIGKNHTLAGRLWKSSVHEARILAALIDDPKQVTEKQMEEWVSSFDSWDICDGCCGSLFDKTEFAYVKAVEWSRRESEFVKRAGFVMMAELAVHDKEAEDSDFIPFLEEIVRGATDDRNFVRKAVNWALRQIGKRSLVLNKKAMRVASGLLRSDSRSAKWVGSDALRELRSESVALRLRRSS